MPSKKTSLLSGANYLESGTPIGSWMPIKKEKLRKNLWSTMQLTRLFPKSKRGAHEKTNHSRIIDHWRVG